MASRDDDNATVDPTDDVANNDTAVETEAPGNTTPTAEERAAKIRERRAAVAAKATSRRTPEKPRPRSAAQSTDIDLDMAVPRVWVKILPGGGTALRPIERRRDGSPVMYKSELRHGPKPGTTVQALVESPDGTMHKHLNAKLLHEGSVHRLFADECAGLVFRGYAELDRDHENVLTEEELIETFCPAALLAEAG